jgi:type IV secretory pathway TrbL component
MRMIFSLIGLLIVVAIVGFLAKSQLSVITQLPNSAPPSANATSNSATPANIAEQSKQIQTQVKDQLNEAMKATADAQQKALDGANNDKPVEKTGSAY